MEKKLTDEEIVKAHKTCRKRKGCIGCPYTEKGMNCNIKNDIRRLQEENEKLNTLVSAFEDLEKALSSEIQRLTEENEAYIKDYEEGKV